MQRVPSSQRKPAMMLLLALGLERGAATIPLLVPVGQRIPDGLAGLDDEVLAVHGVWGLTRPSGLGHDRDHRGDGLLDVIAGPGLVRFELGLKRQQTSVSLLLEGGLCRQ